MGQFLIIADDSLIEPVKQTGVKIKHVVVDFSKRRVKQISNKKLMYLFQDGTVYVSETSKKSFLSKVTEVRNERHITCHSSDEFLRKICRYNQL